MISFPPLKQRSWVRETADTKCVMWLVLCLNTEISWCFSVSCVDSLFLISPCVFPCSAQHSNCRKLCGFWWVSMSGSPPGPGCLNGGSWLHAPFQMRHVFQNRNEYIQNTILPSVELKYQKKIKKSLFSPSSGHLFRVRAAFTFTQCVAAGLTRPFTHSLDFCVFYTLPHD